MIDGSLPKRKNPAHFFMSDKTILGIIFLTVCSKDRKKILANESAHKLLVEAWNKAEYWKVGKYIIMPDHIHLLCCNANYKFPDLKPWVKYWKSEVSKKWYSIADQPIWQNDYWDRQIRSHENFYKKWEYIRNNPVRAGYVKNADNWIHQGQLNILF